MPTWIFGVAINIVGSTTIALGTNLMKVGHSMTEETQLRLAEETGQLEPVPGLFTSPARWWRFRGCKLWSLGTVLFLGGNVANFGSLAFAAQSLIAALGSVQLIANLFLSRWVSRETVSLRIWLATAIIVAGGVLLVAFGNHESPTYTVQDLLALYSGASYIAYMCVGCVLCIASYVCFLQGKRRILAKRAAGSEGGGSVVGRSRWQRWMPFLFSMYAALLGTQSVIYGKTLAMLLRTTLAGDSQVGNWYTWLSLGVFALSAVWWGTRYNQALKLFPVSLIYPVLMTIWLMTSVIAGSMYYQEYKAMATLARIMYGVGMAILLAGMFVLSEEAARNSQVYPSTSTAEKELGELEAPLAGDEEAGGGAGLASSTTYENELFAEALAKKDARVDFLNPLASSPSLTVKLRPPGARDSMLGSDSPPALPRAHAGRHVDCAAQETVALAPGRHECLPSDAAADAEALFMGGLHEDSAATAAADGADGAAAAQPRRPHSHHSRLTVVVESSMREDPHPSLMHDLAQDFGLGDIVQSVRRSIGLGGGSDRGGASTPAFPLFGIPQVGLPSVGGRSPSVASNRSGSSRANSFAAPRGPPHLPPHRYLVGAVRQGPGQVAQGLDLKALGAAKEQHALDALLGAAAAPGAGAGRPGHHKLQRSLSAGELDDIVIKVGRVGDPDGAAAGAAAAERGGDAGVATELATSRSASAELSMAVGETLSPALLQQLQQQRLLQQGSGASSLSRGSSHHSTPRVAAAPGSLRQQYQLQGPAAEGGSLAPPALRHTPGSTMLRASSLPKDAPSSARRPWSTQSRTPTTPVLSRLATPTGEDEAGSTGGSGRVPKDGLVSPRDFLEGLASPGAQAAARELAELLRQQSTRRDKAAAWGGWALRGSQQQLASRHKLGCSSQGMGGEVKAKGGKTPGRALKNFLNKTPIFEKFGSKSRSKLAETDATVDIGALMRHKLMVPKLQGASEERDVAAPAAGVPAVRPAPPPTAESESAPPPPSPPPQQQQEAVSLPGATNNPIYSPDDSLARAASKLAHLKAAASMLKQTSAATAARQAAPVSAGSFRAHAAAAASPAALPCVAQPTTQPPASAAPAPSAGRVPSASPVPGAPPPEPCESPVVEQAVVHRRRGVTATSATPEEYRPEQDEEVDEEDAAAADAAAELAARSALQKRHRRRSVHPDASNRFGEWFTGDDTELDATLTQYNAEDGQQPRRSRRRKSTFPALGKRAAAEADAEAGEEQENQQGATAAAAAAAQGQRRAAGRRRTLAPGADVAARVEAVTQEMRRQDDDRCLRDKLVESWEVRVCGWVGVDGRTYYDRLLAAAQGGKEKDEEEEEEQQEGQQAQQQSQPPAKQEQAGASPEGRPAAAEAQLVAGAACRQQELSKLTDTLESLKVSARRGPGQPAAGAATAAVAAKPQVARAQSRAVRSRSHSPDAQQGPAAVGGPAEASRAVAGAAAPAATGAGAWQAALGGTGVSDAELQLRTELAACMDLLNAALADKARLEAQAKATHKELAAEQQAKEEQQARKAAEKRAKELAGQLAEAKRRASDTGEAARHAAAGAADKVGDLEARCGAAEVSLQTILKAASALGKELGKAAAAAREAGDLLRSEAGGPNSARGDASDPNSARGSKSTAPAKQGWRQAQEQPMSHGRTARCAGTRTEARRAAATTTTTQLQEILGIGEQAAASLLESTGGDLESAVALGLAGGGGQAPGAPPSPRAQLVSILGGTVNRAQAAALLARARGNADAAVTLYFEEGGAPPAPSDSGPITLEDDDSSALDDSEEREEEEEEPEVEVSGRGPGQGRGLVRSPVRGGGRGRGVMEAPIAMPPFSVLARMIDAAFGFDGALYDSSDEEPLSDEEPEVPRLNPKETEQLPDLSTAAADSLQLAGPAVVPAAMLPLPALRGPSVGGAPPRLHAPEQAGVPAAAPVPRPLQLPLPLGEVRLPLHSLDAGRLDKLCGKQAWGDLVWDSKKGQLKHDYVGPPQVPGWFGSRGECGRRMGRHQGAARLRLACAAPSAPAGPACVRSAAACPTCLPSDRLRPAPHAGAWRQLSQLTTYCQPVYLEAHAALALHGPAGTPEDRVALVCDESSWVSELLYNLWLLEVAGLVDVRCTLAGPQQGQEQEQERQQGGAAADDAAAAGAEGEGGEAMAARRKKKGKKAADAAEGSSGKKKKKKKKEAPAKLAAGSKGSKRGRDGRQGAAGASPATDNAGPSSSRPPAGAGSSAADAAPPTHVRVHVFLTKQAGEELFWDGEAAGVGEELGGGGDGSKRRKGKGSMRAARAQKYTAALARVVAALLARGTGLRLGPDADALLNFGDTCAEEWAAVCAEDPAARHREFDLERLLGATSLPGAAPAAVAPPGLVAHPKHYQLQGLQWMLDRERQGDALGRGHAHLHPGWLQLVTSNGQLLYLYRLRPHMLSSTFYSAPIGGTCGGFLCDEMGLGKTLEALMLTISNPAPPGWAVTSLKRQTWEEGEPVPIKATLVVVPANLLQQWADEIERHIEPGVLSWARYVPPGAAAAEAAAAAPESDGVSASGRPVRRRRNPSADGWVHGANVWVDGRKKAPVVPVVCVKPDGSKLPMHEADLVLMSYEHLRDQMHATGGNRSSLLNQFGFWRVMLDEAQARELRDEAHCLVANSSSVAAIMASSLWRRHAWVVTGTPITSRLDELKGLLEFLAYEPFYHATEWRALLQAGYEARTAPGLLSLRALLRGVMLRRAKADVASELDLQPCSREDKWVTLSSVERLVYERAKRAFVNTAFQLQQHAGAASRAAGDARAAGAAARATGRAMSALTALRQSCCHPQIVRRTDETYSTKERLSMRQIMQRLVGQASAYVEWDQALRRQADAKLLLAAVQCGPGGFPGEQVQAVLALIRAQTQAASADIRKQVASRRMDGTPASPEEQEQERGVTASGDSVAAAPAGGSAGGTAEGASSAGAAVTAGQVAPSERGDSPSAGESSARVGSVAGGAAPVLVTRKRARTVEAEQAPPPQQQQQQQPQIQREQQQQAQQPQQPQQEQQPPAKQALGAPAADAARPSDGGGGGAAAQEALTEEEKEARARHRAWRKLELDGLELFAHMVKQCGSDKAAAAAEKRKKDKEKKKGENEREGQPPRPAKRQRLEAGATAGASPGGAQDLNGDLDEAGPSAGAAASPAPAPPPSREALDAQLAEATGAIAALRAELGMGEDAAAMRRSKRKAGIEAGSTQEVVLDVEAAEEQLANAKVAVRAYNETLARRHPARSARTALAAADKEVAERWHHLKHMVNKEAALLAAEKGKVTVAPGAGAAPQAADPASGALQQDDMATCPICLDEIFSRTITSCGHHYCSTCIRECLSNGRRPCPICRTEIAEADLFDAVSEEEARAQAAAKEAAAACNADYGAKVAALLEELAAMRAADPTAKAVVFSSWGRLLKLVGDALQANGVAHATLAGASPVQRQEALDRFHHDPACAVLTVVMSNSGGAAGLTLTVATTAFILEPGLNPGLEAQAAARIYRLGQARPTRVVRILACDTVESQVLEVQRRKVESGAPAAELGAAEMDAGMLLQVYEAVRDERR
eukprot:scaffold1.g5493.t1